MRAWLRLGALAVLAGCAQPTPPPASAPASAPVAAAGAVPVPAPGPPAAAVPPRPANVPLPSLLDLRTPELQARFGAPRRSRRDGGAEVWGYEAAGICSVNLVLQRERSGQKVVHAQARLQPGVDEARCLAAIGRGR